MTERSTHSTTVGAPVDVVYDLIANAADWPAIFAPTVHVEHLERGATEERFRIWALANDTVKNWTSRRTLDPVRRVVTFHQEVSQAPVAAMSGEWLCTPVDGGTHVELRHTYSAVDDDPDALAWIRRALDTNSAAELANLGRAAATGPVLRFADGVRVDGPLEAAYRFIDEAELWPARLPHVDSVDLTVDDAGVQHLTMHTVAPDGSRHVTSSVRVRLETSIAYKQTTLPKLLSGHSGRWIFTPDGDGTLVTSEHTITIDRDAVTSVLGPDGTEAQAREYARRALSGNSMITLRHAQGFAASAAVLP